MTNIAVALRTRHSIRVAAVFVTVALVAVIGPAIVQAEQGDPRAEREEIRAQQAEAAAGLDAATATNDQLEAAVATLTLEVDIQASRADAAAQAAQAARQELAAAQIELDDKRLEVSDLQDQIQSQAVETYVHTDDNITTSFVQSDNVNEAVTRRAIVDQVAGTDVDTLDQLTLMRAELEAAEEQADDAAAKAEERDAAEASQLDALQNSLAAQKRQAAELELRIQSFRAEADSLAADEDALTAIIERQDRERAARAEAARAEAAQAEAARQAAADAAAAPSAGSGNADSSGASPDADSPAPTIPAATPAPPPSSGGMIWPTNGTVTSEFGPRWGRLHSGIDIAAPSGTPIVAAAGGTVTFAGPQGAYGLVVIIDHGNGLTSIYAHQSALVAVQGQSVSQGTLIGKVGTTGNSTGNHVHFEVRSGGTSVNPRNFL